MSTRKRACSHYHQEGVNAAHASKDQASCPYKDGEEKSLWYEGWDAAKRAIFRTTTKDSK